MIEPNGGQRVDGQRPMIAHRRHRQTGIAMTQPDAPTPSGPPAPPTTPMPAYPPAQPGYGQPPAEPAFRYPPVAPYAYPPVPPTPPRKGRVGLIVALSLTATLVLAAAGVTAVLTVNRYAPVRPVAGPPTSAPASASATPSPTASPTPAPFTGDLRKLLLPIPAGAKAYAVPVLGTDGTITVEQASKDNYGDLSEVDYLKAIGFQHGAWVAWTRNGQSTFVEIYQFLYDSYTQEWADAFSRKATASYATGIDVPGVP